VQHAARTVIASTKINKNTSNDTSVWLGLHAETSIWALFVAWYQTKLSGQRTPDEMGKRAATLGFTSTLRKFS